MGMKYEKKNFPRLYALLYSIGVNSLIWNKDGSQVEVDLEKVAREPDLSQMPPEKRPLLNPTLQLSGIYFMQELRRPVEKEKRKNLHEQEEELIADLKKADFLVALNPEGDDPKKSACPI